MRVLPIISVLICLGASQSFADGRNTHPSPKEEIIQQIDASGDNGIPLPPYAGHPFFGNILRAWLLHSNTSVLQKAPQASKEPQFIWAEKLVKDEKLTSQKIDSLIQNQNALEPFEKLFLRALVDWHPWREKSRIRDRWITLGWNNSLAIPRASLMKREALFSFIQVYCGLILIDTQEGLIAEHFVPQYLSTMARVPKTITLLQEMVKSRSPGRIRIIIAGTDEFLNPLYLNELSSSIKSKFPSAIISTYIIDKTLPDRIDHLMYVPRTGKVFRASTNGFGYTTFRQMLNLCNVLPDLSRPFLSEVTLRPANLRRVAGSNDTRK